MKILLLGCGGKRQRVIVQNNVVSFSDFNDSDEVTTVDINPDHKPDIVHDLNILPLPFEDDSFDEIHAYEVFEHIGKQGNYQKFFWEFSEYWRILKPGGLIIGSVPAWNGVWAWGDPSHTRVIPLEQFVFLSQKQYANQVGRTAMSDFRNIYKADLEIDFGAYVGDNAYFVLRAVK